jgi:hypothetical protein
MRWPGSRSGPAGISPRSLLKRLSRYPHARTWNPRAPPRNVPACHAAISLHSTVIPGLDPGTSWRRLTGGLQTEVRMPSVNLLRGGTRIKSGYDEKGGEPGKVSACGIKPWHDGWEHTPNDQILKSPTRELKNEHPVTQVTFLIADCHQYPAREAECTAERKTNPFECNGPPWASFRNDRRNTSWRSSAITATTF